MSFSGNYYSCASTATYHPYTEAWHAGASAYPTPPYSPGGDLPDDAAVAPEVCPPTPKRAKNSATHSRGATHSHHLTISPPPGSVGPDRHARHHYASAYDALPLSPGRHHRQNGDGAFRRAHQDTVDQGAFAQAPQRILVWPANSVVVSHQPNLVIMDMKPTPVVFQKPGWPEIGITVGELLLISTPETVLGPQSDTPLASVRETIKVKITMAAYPTHAVPKQLKTTDSWYAIARKLAKGVETFAKEVKAENVPIRSRYRKWALKGCTPSASQEGVDFRDLIITRLVHTNASEWHLELCMVPPYQQPEL